MTYKSKYLITMCVSIIAIIVAVILMVGNMRDKSADVVESEEIEFLSGTDDFGNEFKVFYYPEEEFCLLNIYMEESKDYSWQWSNYTNEIICNYIHYQDDHYVVSFKPSDEYTTDCQSIVMFTPLQDEHAHTMESTTDEYSAYMIEVGYPEEGGYGFNVYPAVVTDTYTNDGMETTYDNLPEGAEIDETEDEESSTDNDVDTTDDSSSVEATEDETSVEGAEEAE